MATKGAQSSILVDEFDFSGVTNGWDLEIAIAEGDATVINSTGMEYEPLLPRMTLRQNGYVTTVGAAGTWEQELQARLGTGTAIVAAELDRDVTGSPVYVLPNAAGSNMTFSAPAANVMTLNGVWGFTDAGNRGLRVARATVTATGNQTAVDFGAAGSAGGVGYLFVQSITGSATNASFKLQSSATSGGTYADECTFTVSAVGAYRATFNGTANRWQRLNVASLGGATGFTVVAVSCINGVTQ